MTGGRGAEGWGEEGGREGVDRGKVVERVQSEGEG